MFHSYFERKYYKVLTFDIAHFPNFELLEKLRYDLFKSCLKLL